MLHIMNFAAGEKAFQRAGGLDLQTSIKKIVSNVVTKKQGWKRHLECPLQEDKLVARCKEERSGTHVLVSSWVVKHSKASLAGEEILVKVAESWILHVDGFDLMLAFCRRLDQGARVIKVVSGRTGQ